MRVNQSLKSNLKEMVNAVARSISALRRPSKGTTVKKPPTAELREYQWRGIFKTNNGSWFCLVVSDGKGRLTGFAKGQLYAHEDLPGYKGELNKIYLLNEYHRLGLGTKLLCTVARRFLRMGINNMVLLGDAKNPTFRFYEAMGAERLYNKNGGFDGGYGWKDLNTLAAKC